MTLNHKVTSLGSPLLASVAHGFFTRRGGVSKGVFAELNGGIQTSDNKYDILKNRQIIASSLGGDCKYFPAIKQVHGSKVVVVRDNIWAYQDAPQADSIISISSKVTVGIATADCAPVLFSSNDGHIVAAAHAGWRGAVCGVLEETYKEMLRLGAYGIKAVIGPCIGQASYEVSLDMKQEVLKKHPFKSNFFIAIGNEKYLFDLGGFCKALLEDMKVEVDILRKDVFLDNCFFSYRRSQQKNEETGRQISAIRPI